MRFNDGGDRTSALLRNVGPQISGVNLNMHNRGQIYIYIYIENNLVNSRTLSEGVPPPIYIRETKPPISILSVRLMVL